MIQANELRIWNWVQYKIDEVVQPTKFRIIDNKPVQVQSISFDHLLEDQLPDSYCINHSSRKHFFPIPLTPEILEKCGFEKEPLAYSINIDKFGGGKRLTFSGDYLYIIDSEKQNTIPTEIITLWNKDLMKEFYLHDLQNLYYALTKQELNYKP